MDMAKGYMDGIVVTGLVYVLSPPADKIRNAVIIGVAHGLLHPMACDYLHKTEGKH